VNATPRFVSRYADERRHDVNRKACVHLGPCASSGSNELQGGCFGKVLSEARHGLICWRMACKEMKHIAMHRGAFPTNGTGSWEEAMAERAKEKQNAEKEAGTGVR